MKPICIFATHVADLVNLAPFRNLKQTFDSVLNVNGYKKEIIVENCVKVENIINILPKSMSLSEKISVVQNNNIIDENVKHDAVKKLNCDYGIENEKNVYELLEVNGYNIKNKQDAIRSDVGNFILYAKIDGICERPDNSKNIHKYVCEIKSRTKLSTFNKIWFSDVVQLNIYMALTGIHKGIIVNYFSGNIFVKEFEFNPVMYNYIINRLEYITNNIKKNNKLINDYLNDIISHEDIIHIIFPEDETNHIECKNITIKS